MPTGANQEFMRSAVRFFRLGMKQRDGSVIRLLSLKPMTFAMAAAGLVTVHRPYGAERWLDGWKVVQGGRGA